MYPDDQKVNLDDPEGPRVTQNSQEETFFSKRATAEKVSCLSLVSWTMKYYRYSYYMENKVATSILRL